MLRPPSARGPISEGPLKTPINSPFASSCAKSRVSADGPVQAEARIELMDGRRPLVCTVNTAGSGQAGSEGLSPEGQFRRASGLLEFVQPEGAEAEPGVGNGVRRKRAHRAVIFRLGRSS